MNVFILKADANRYQGLLPSDRSSSLEVFQLFHGTPIGTSCGIMDITRHEFFRERLTSPIFKIPQVVSMDVFATDKFDYCLT
jgi:hypothetical protein